MYDPLIYNKHFQTNYSKALGTNLQEIQGIVDEDALYNVDISNTFTKSGWTCVIINKRENLYLSGIK